MTHRYPFITINIKVSTGFNISSIKSIRNLNNTLFAYNGMKDNYNCHDLLVIEAFHIIYKKSQNNARNANEIESGIFLSYCKNALRMVHFSRPTKEMLYNGCVLLFVYHCSNY